MRSLFHSIGKYLLAATLLVSTLGFLLWGLSSTPENPQLRPPVSDVSLGRWNTNESFQSTLAKAHQALAVSLEDEGLSAAPRADWLTICRRQSLALVGCGVSLEEIRWLQTLPEPQRTTAHLERLLDDSRFHDYWAERWSRFLVGNDEGQFVLFRRRRFRVWLAEQFAADVRYDQLVRELITANGLWSDRPQVNFLTATVDSNDGQPDPVRLAARTSRVFLGLRIDCLQCHDDFLGNVSLGDPGNLEGGTQQHFHKLAAFYTAAEVNGLQGIRDREADYEYKYLGDDEATPVQPGVPFGQAYLPAEGEQRERLAAWITSPKNRQAARSAVSHVWALMFGQPDGESIDNLPFELPMGPVAETFVDDFIDHGYDLRRLIRLIAASQPFTVDSRADFEITRRHEMAGAAFPLVRLRGEQVAGCVLQASRIKTVDRDSSLISQLIQLAAGGEFVTRFGDRGENELESDSVTITQRLLLMNGDLSKESVKPNPLANATSHLIMFSGDHADVIEAAYLCTLNRYPSENEMGHFVTRFDEAKSREEAISDLFWVLLNCSEFSWNH
ncbi:MAG: DUF1549 domain-containing protein [Planctomycetota bacterium]